MREKYEESRRLEARQACGRRHGIAAPGSQGEVTRTSTSDCSATPLLNVFYASRHRHLFKFNLLTF
jgi:hypothetical protein